MSVVGDVGATFQGDDRDAILVDTKTLASVFWNVARFLESWQLKGRMFQVRLVGQQRSSAEKISPIHLEQ